MQKSGKTVTVKIKTFQYETLSKQTSLRDSVQSETDIYNIAYSLYNELKDPDVPIRLIGVTVGNLEQSSYRNMTIYDFYIENKADYHLNIVVNQPLSLRFFP